MTCGRVCVCCGVAFGLVWRHFNPARELLAWNWSEVGLVGFIPIAGVSNSLQAISDDSSPICHGKKSGLGIDSATPAQMLLIYKALKSSRHLKKTDFEDNQ